MQNTEKMARHFGQLKCGYPDLVKLTAKRPRSRAPTSPARAHRAASLHQRIRRDRAGKPSPIEWLDPRIEQDAERIQPEHAGVKSCQSRFSLDAAEGDERSRVKAGSLAATWKQSPVNAIQRGVNLPDATWIVSLYLPRQAEHNNGKTMIILILPLLENWPRRQYIILQQPLQSLEWGHATEATLESHGRAAEMGCDEATVSRQLPLNSSWARRWGNRF